LPKRLYSRRTILKTLLALGAGGVSLVYRDTLAAADNRRIALPAGGAKEATLEVFTALSAIVTLHDDLDSDAAARMHKIFMDEPWGPDHIVRSYNKLRAALGNKSRAVLTEPSWQLDEGERWFVGHLLTTWYLGIYYHNERPTQRVTYEHALMFAPVRGVIPIPFFENTPFGEWADPPKVSP
jgi:hypothetical protein